MKVNSQTAGPGRQIEPPETLVRIASMAQAMLVAARSTPCDRAGCERFLEIYAPILHQLNDVLPEKLRAVANRWPKRRSLPLWECRASTCEWQPRRQSAAISSGMVNHRRLSKCSVAQSRS